MPYIICSFKALLYWYQLQISQIYKLEDVHLHKNLFQTYSYTTI